MLRNRYNGSSLAVGKRRGEPMREPDEVRAMLRLHESGWGTRRIAREFGVSRNTVKRYRGRLGIRVNFGHSGLLLALL